jgi:hypothetical protein
MGKEEVRDAALKNDNANGIILRGQPAREPVELAEQGRIHQVDRVVVDRHTGDSTLDADVKGRQVRRTYEKFQPLPPWVNQRAVRRACSGVWPYIRWCAAANRPRWVNPQRCAM